MTTKIKVSNSEDSKHYVIAYDNYSNVTHTIRPGSSMEFHVHRPGQISAGEGAEIASANEQKKKSRNKTLPALVGSQL